MKKILPVLSIFLLSAFGLVAQVVDKLDVSGPILFDKTFYVLAKAEEPIPGYYVQEYLPEGENLSTYNKMFAIYVFANDMSLQDAVSVKTLELINLKKNEPLNNYRVTQSPGGNEYIIEGIKNTTGAKQILTTEFFVYRLRKVHIGNGKNGVLIVAYANRKYGDDVKPFLRKIRKERTDILNTMIEAELPEIRVKN